MEASLDSLSEGNSDISDFMGFTEQQCLMLPLTCSPWQQDFPSGNCFLIPAGPIGE